MQTVKFIFTLVFCVFCLFIVKSITLKTEWSVSVQRIITLNKFYVYGICQPALRCVSPTHDNKVRTEKNENDSSGAV